MKIGMYILLVTRIAAFAQGLHLSAGDSFYYEFQTLPLNHPEDIRNQAIIGVELSASDILSAGDALFLEMFENDSSETSIQSRVYTGSGITQVGMFQADAWQDLQGGLRLTVQSGSVDLSMLHLTVIRGTFSYSTSVAIPEPGIWQLSVLGVLPLLFIALRKRRRGGRAWSFDRESARARAREWSM